MAIALNEDSRLVLCPTDSRDLASILTPDQQAVVRGHGEVML
jgi:hypothetical protein